MALIAKELLRERLSCAERGGLRYEIHAALDRFYRFCAARTAPEVIGFDRTVEAWQNPIIAAAQTGLTTAAAYGGPAPVEHGESHPASTNATANCEDRRSASAFGPAGRLSRNLGLPEAPIMLSHLIH